MANFYIKRGVRAYRGVDPRTLKPIFQSETEANRGWNYRSVIWFNSQKEADTVRERLEDVIDTLTGKFPYNLQTQKARY